MSHSLSMSECPRLNGRKASDWLRLCRVTIGLCSIERAVFDYRTLMNDTRLEPCGSLFLPGWRECGVKLTGKQAVLLMHDTLPQGVKSIRTLL